MPARRRDRKSNDARKQEPVAICPYAEPLRACDETSHRTTNAIESVKQHLRQLALASAISGRSDASVRNSDDVTAVYVPWKCPEQNFEPASDDVSYLNSVILMIDML